MTRPRARYVLAALVVAGLVSIAAAAVWKWGVVPVQNWVAQRDEITRLEAELAEIEASNAALAGRGGPLADRCRDRTDRPA